MSKQIEKMSRDVAALEAEAAATREKLAKVAGDRDTKRAARDAAEGAYAENPTDAGWSAVERARGDEAKLETIERALSARVDVATAKVAEARGPLLVALYGDAIGRTSDAAIAPELASIEAEAKECRARLVALDKRGRDLAAAQNAAVDDAERFGAELGKAPHEIRDDIICGQIYVGREDPRVRRSVEVLRLYVAAMIGAEEGRETRKGHEADRDTSRWVDAAPGDAVFLSYSPDGDVMEYVAPLRPKGAKGLAARAAGAFRGALS